MRSVGAMGAEDVDIVVTRLAAPAEAVRAAVTVLSEAERRRASRFAFDRDARRFIVARSHLRALLAQRLGGGARAELIGLEYGAQGKPALSRPFADSGLHFSVSHCDDVALYAFSWGRAIGVDVERVRVMADADGVAAHCFSPAEYATYQRLDPDDKPLGFFNCWTRKEAFVKALGCGLSLPLDRFDVTLAPGDAAAVRRVDDTPGDCGWRMNSSSPAHGYVAAVAWHE